MRLSSLLTPLLTAVVLVSGSVEAASGITAMTLPGVSKFDMKTATMADFSKMSGAMVHARNLLLALPQDTVLPLPCSHEMFYGEMAGGKAAFHSVSTALIAQGWQPGLAIQGGAMAEVAFQLKKNSVTLLGLWTDVPGAKRAALLLCEQAKDWKPGKGN